MFDGTPHSPLAYPAGRQAGFNPAHLALRGGVCKLSVIPNRLNMRNLISGRPGTPVGTIIEGRSNLGPYATVNLGTSEVTFPGNATTTETQVTFACIAAFVVITNTGVISNSSDGTNGLWFGMSGGGFLICQQGGAGGFQIGPGAVANIPYFAAVSSNGTSAYWVARRLDTGKTELATTAGLAMAGAGDGTYITLNNKTTGNHLSLSPVYAAMYATSFLSRAELAMWAENPWDFWYPQENK